jgi:hypothetical protein
VQRAGISRLSEITRAVLERFQRYLLKTISEYIEESNGIIAMFEKTSTYLSGRIKMKLREYQNEFIK